MSEEDLRLVEAFTRSRNTRTTDLTLMGNRNTIVQIVSLLSQIRTALRNNQKTEINLKIGYNVQDSDFEFLVNDTRADDLVPKENVEIN